MYETSSEFSFRWWCFFIGVLTKSLSLLKTGMLVLHGNECCPSLSDGLGEVWIWVFEPTLPYWNGTPGAGRFSEVVPLRGWLMSSLQPLPFTGQACKLEMNFSLGETVKFQLAPSFSKAVQCLAFTSSFCPSLHGFGHQFFPEGVQVNGWNWGPSS
jgi:hypothetical protein